MQQRRVYHNISPPPHTHTLVICHPLPPRLRPMLRYPVLTNCSCRTQQRTPAPGGGQAPPLGSSWFLLCHTTCTATNYRPSASEPLHPTLPLGIFKISLLLTHIVGPSLPQRAQPGHQHPYRSSIPVTHNPLRLTHKPTILGHTLARLLYRHDAHTNYLSRFWIPRKL